MHGHKYELLVAEMLKRHQLYRVVVRFPFCKMRNANWCYLNAFGMYSSVQLSNDQQAFVRDELAKIAWGSRAVKTLHLRYVAWFVAFLCMVAIAHGFRVYSWKRPLNGG